MGVREGGGKEEGGC